MTTLPSPGRRRFSFGRFMLLLFLVLLLALVGAVAMTGMVPGLSRMVGATEPRNLGVTPTPADFQNVVTRIGYQLDNQPAATDPSRYQKVYAGRKALDQTFSNAELSALLTHNHVTWWPLQQVQVRTSSDGTMEVAAALVTANIPWSEFPASVRNYLPKVMPAKLPVYVKGRIDVLGPTEVRLDLDRVEVGRVPLPDSVLNAEGQAQATRYVNDRIRAIPGFTIQELSYQEGKVRFQGTFPESFRRVTVGP